jgi:fatty-acid desaturase
MAKTWLIQKAPVGAVLYNHQAFPESARMGLDAGQIDTGWIVLGCLKKMGLVWNLGVPRADHLQEDIENRPNFLQC